MANLVLTGSVGIGGKNNPADIKKVQVSLNKCLHLLHGIIRLKEDSSLGVNPAKSNTVVAIMAFQKKIVGIIKPDGVIDVNGRTHKKLNSILSTSGTITAAKTSLLTFPGTTFTYSKTSKTLAECLSTLPNEFRNDFKNNITHIIKEMHKLGIALGINKRVKAGYRTFHDQSTIPASATKAGPGESFHNYGIAADLGVLDWVDNKGKSHSTDYWLGEMDKMPEYKGFSKKIWEKRNSFGASKVYPLMFEIIHLQALPATTSGREALVKCLNEVAKTTDFSYKKGHGSSKMYQCKVSKTASWVDIGTAKEIWAGTIKNVTPNDKITIISHMKKADAIAKTIKLP
jgi:hypothetical protein